jgi:hypothetical protein
VPRANNTQGALAVVGWVNTKKFWETGDAGASQGWTALIVDTNANGKRDAGYTSRGGQRKLVALSRSKAGARSMSPRRAARSSTPSLALLGG